MNLDWTIEDVGTNTNTTVKENTTDVKKETVTIDNSLEVYQQTMDNLASKYEKQPCTFNDVEAIAYDMLDTLPKLDFTALTDEMAQMRVEIYEDPSTMQLTEALCKVQEYKNRLSEIMNIVEHEYVIRKRVNDMLFD